MLEFVKKTWESLTHNHALMMALCIGPWIVIGAAYALGYRSPLLWPAALVLCIGSHVLMMAAHTGGDGKDDKKSCH
ncbi:hypothetical protein HY994_00550 [Candidatus Micrarchaeota archaeon]|nr:hypothetical protein [Candidatus Micrarchaeota archaeon]